MFRKKYYFLSGLPRSGNTLLASLLNQNKKITVTANSPVIGYLGGFTSCDEVTQNVLNNFDTRSSIDNVAKNIIPNYYSHYKSRYIIDRGSWGTESSLKLLQKYCTNDVKIIVMIRDVVEVLASFIKWSKDNPNNFIDTQFSTIEEQCEYLMDPNGMIAYGLLSIFNLLKPENSKYAHFVDYNFLVQDPEKEVKKIYEFLNIKNYKHNFNSIEQLNINGVTYNDSQLRKNLHTIRENGIYKNKYAVENYLPTHLIKKYSEFNFW